jgi:hypothetical protein
MSLSAVVLTNEIYGDKRRTRTFLAFGQNYPTNGEPLTARQLGLYKIDNFTASRAWTSDVPPQALVAITASATPDIYVQVYQGDYDNAADGPMVEVPNATDLTGLFASIIAWGH